MPTAIYFANNKMKIVRGKIKKQDIIIDNYMSIDLPKDVISDGIINDDTALYNILYELKKSKKIDKECFATIHSSQILSKAVDLPYMKPQKIKVAAHREFEALDDGNEEYIFDYSVLESRSADGNHGRVLFSAMPWFMLERYIDIFNDAGLSLTSCDMFLNCIIKYVSLIPELQAIPYILAFSENNILTSFLFAEGKYLFSNRSQLLSEPGTDEYAGEIAGKFSAIKQFYKAEKHSVALEHAYIFGLNDEDKDQSRTLVGYLGIQMDMIPESPSVKVNAQSNTGEPFSAGEYLATIGCLMRK
jgi:hypothetical protein